MKQNIILLLLLTMCARSGFSDQSIKEPNVSGQFYPADPAELAQEVQGHIEAASNPVSDKRIEVIIAPHAGYYYSGAIAGHSFKAVQNAPYATVVILAPSHFHPFDGVSIWKEGGLRTPLGTVPVDADFAKELIRKNEKFYFDPQAYNREHSLEVELPFLQRSLKNFKVVPIIMGQASYETCQALAQALKDVIADRQDVLIVVSTDLSHYHDDATARAMDHATLTAVKELNAGKIWQLCTLGRLEMCGFIPVTTALIYAQLKGLPEAQIIRYANSGDVTNDRDRVVGYSSVVIHAAENGAEEENADKAPPESTLTLEQKKHLLQIARRTIEEYVRTRNIPEVQESDPRLQEEEGAFVTIHRKGLLRGCIGHVIGDAPLYQTVRDMAIAAATQDPRFPPMQVEELADFEVEVSVLSKPRPAQSPEEIQMGVHGVIVSRAGRQGLFLPQVATETGWSREEFLSQLCSQKAGLPKDAWKDPQTRLDIFTADVFSEHDMK